MKINELPKNVKIYKKWEFVFYVFIGRYWKCLFQLFIELKLISAFSSRVGKQNNFRGDLMDIFLNIA